MTPPGPRRSDGLPHGPDQVRRSVLDAAAVLFGVNGVPQVTLRDIANEARVNLGLISRYIGTRDELIREVFSDLTSQLLSEMEADPTGSRGFEDDSIMVRWNLVLTYLVITAPTDAVAIGGAITARLRTIIEQSYGTSPDSARLRAAQIMAAAIGWRLFEPFLIASAELEHLPVEDVRLELTRSNRRLGSTPFPSPPDPLERVADD